ncbi:MAG: hypothetical protein MJ088_02110 [Clostridia bacterium]|nr:hypothetical protein [Clostridia bacterium]
MEISGPIGRPSGSVPETLLAAVREAAGVPVCPVPLKTAGEAVVYRWYPGVDDGSLCRGRLELRFVAAHIADALRRVETVTRALVGEGDSAIVGEGASAVLVIRVADGGGSGYCRGTGLYFVKAGFLASARSGQGEASHAE